MKLLVDVKRAVQEYDLDAGTTKNFLIFSLGGAEHKVEATEKQLQQAIADAHVSSTGLSSAAEPLAEIEDEDEDEDEPDIEDVAAYLVAEGLSEAEVRSTLMRTFPDAFDDSVMQAYSSGEVDEPITLALFEDFSGQPTAEEMAEYTSDKDQMPFSVDISSDDISEGGTLEAIITGPHEAAAPTHAHPVTGLRRHLSQAQASRVEGIRDLPHLSRKQTKKDKMAALRARARSTPSRTVQADEAGNPITRQTIQAQKPVLQSKPMPSLPGFDDDGFSQG